MNQNEAIEICVIDDNPQDLKWIIECVRQALPDAGTDAFSELSGFIRQGKKYDLLLLDIVLGETLSIHHAGYLQKYASYILYVTGIDELMRASFGPKVVGYCIKQDGKQALIEKLREIYRRYMTASETVPLIEGDRRIDFNHVLYLMSANRMIRLYSEEGNHIILDLSLRECEIRYDRYLFRISRTVLVNPDHIIRFTDRSVVLSDNKELEVSRRRQKPLKQLLLSRQV